MRCRDATAEFIGLSRHRSALVLVALLLLPLAASGQADDAAQLDRYLERLGLIDLRLVHHEQQLADTRDEAAKAKLARQLSDLYAQRLLEAADEPQRFAELVVRVEKLLSDYPTLDSPQLAVLLLQAEYQRAEALALAWIDDPANLKPRRDAQAILGRIGPLMQDRRQQLSSQLEELQTRYDSSEEPVEKGPRKKRRAPANVATLEQEMNRTQAVLARALFFEGWACFFGGLVEESQVRSEARFGEAETAFATLLEIGTAEATTLELEPDSLGLDSVWRARGLLGLAAALSAQGKEKLAAECFMALAHPATAVAVRETALYWHLLALVGSGRFEAAEELAVAELSSLAPGQTGRAPACALLVRTGWANDAAGESSEKLARLGLAGLARLRQFDVLGALLAKYRPEPKASDGFYALWAKGKLVFAEAEKNSAARDYQRAAAWFTQALEQPEAKDDLAAAAQCRYSLAWCHYRRNEFEDAVRLFIQAANQLKALADDTAVQSAWMVFTCYQQLHAKTKEPKYQQLAAAALADVKRDFPTSDQAQRADLMLARLTATASSPAETVKTYAAISPDSPNYVSARYELCLARHNLYVKSRSDAKAAAVLAGEVRRDVDVYLAAAPESEGTRRLRAALLAVDVLLSGSSPAWDDAADYLRRVSKSAGNLRDDDPLAPEFHYRLLQLAQHKKEESQVEEQAAWLAKNAANSPYELPGLVIAARHADAQVAAASAAEKNVPRLAAIAVYERLVKLLGESSAAIAAKKNALVANLKLAQYEFDAGRFAAAAGRLEEIVAAVPTDRNYLRRAGLAWFKAGEHAKALPHWNTLAAGSDSASDAWYEARYHQLACLATTDPPAAAKAWRQFKLLHPEVKSPAWRAPFAELEKTRFK